MNETVESTACSIQKSPTDDSLTSTSYSSKTIQDSTASCQDNAHEKCSTSKSRQDITKNFTPGGIEICSINKFTTVGEQEFGGFQTTVIQTSMSGGFWPDMLWMSSSTFTAALPPPLPSSLTTLFCREAAGCCNVAVNNAGLTSKKKETRFQCKTRKPEKLESLLELWANTMSKFFINVQSWTTSNKKHRNIHGNHYTVWLKTYFKRCTVLNLQSICFITIRKKTNLLLYEN